MKVIAKNTNEVLNILYGDEQTYNFSKNGVIAILKEHMNSLERIYDYLEDTDMIGEEQYDLGDVMNLLEVFIYNLEYKKEEK